MYDELSRGYRPVMTSDQSDSNVHESKEREGWRHQEDGQISETTQANLEIGGAEATDKSTGTAADRADQPRD